jgi:hypothetical protein
MNTLRFSSFAFVVATLLAGCGSANQDAAVLGPNPGGGFYCPHNAFIGCAYPSGGYQRKMRADIRPDG